MNYEIKYLKYKIKYLNLKQNGGVNFAPVMAAHQNRDRIHKNNIDRQKKEKEKHEIYEKMILNFCMEEEKDETKCKDPKILNYYKKLYEYNNKIEMYKISYPDRLRSYEYYLSIYNSDLEKKIIYENELALYEKCKKDNPYTNYFICKKPEVQYFNDSKPDKPVNPEEYIHRLIKPIYPNN